MAIERDIVKPPNEEDPGDRREDGFLPLTGSPSPAKPPNEGPGGDRRGGSANLTGMVSPVRPPDHRFRVESLDREEVPAAVEPGKGAIPTSPFLPSGFPAGLTPMKQPGRP